MFCSKCGRSLPEDATFCPACGHPVGPGSPSPAPAPPPNVQALFQSVFDFSFTKFVTPNIARVLYAIAVGLAGLITVVLILVGFSASTLSGVLAIIFLPAIVFLPATIYARVLLEMIIVVFRVADRLETLAEKQRP